VYRTTGRWQPGQVGINAGQAEYVRALSPFGYFLEGGEVTTHNTKKNQNQNQN